MTDDARDKPYTAALRRFDPSAEPYANMAPGRLAEMKVAALERGDLPAYWLAELHFAGKLPPDELFAHELIVAAQFELMAMERRGELPEGWFRRHGVATATMARTLARRYATPGGPPPPTTADVAAGCLAAVIRDDPALAEQLQAQLEDEHGGPLVAPRRPRPRA